MTRVGIAAVIGGTVLGKEFVDKVVSYIESFNQVTNAVPGLVGSTVPSTGQKISSQPSLSSLKTEKKDDDKKDQKDDDTSKSRFSPYTNVNPYPVFASTEPFSYLTLDDFKKELISPYESIMNENLSIPYGSIEEMYPTLSSNNELWIVTGKRLC